MLARPAIRRRLAFAALLSGVALLAARCDSVPLLAPTASTITVSTDRTTLPVNGQAVLTATVVEPGGTPVHNGTLVRFTTTLGTIDPVEARTHGGAVTARLIASGESGTATVGAISGSAVAAPVTIQIGGAAAAAIALTATPGTIPSSGGTVTLIATVTDASGNGLLGVPVTFSAGAGTLAATNVLTDTFGQAKTTIVTDRETTVTASAGGQTSTATVSVNNPPTATIAVPTTDPVIGQTTLFSVTVTAGTNAVTKVTMDFGDGQSQSLGATTGTSTISHVYTSAATFTATLTVTDAGGESVSGTAVIVVKPAPPLNVNLSASPSPAEEDEVVTLTATVSGSTVPVIRYDWGLGDGNTASTSGNIITHVYDLPNTYIATVTATNTDGIKGSTQTALVVAPTVFAVNLNFSPSSPRSGSLVTFTATVSPSTTAVDRYDWSFGDGDTVTTSSNTTSHTYTLSSGSTGTTFTVEVTAFKAIDGTSTSSQVTILVQP